MSVSSSKVAIVTVLACLASTGLAACSPNAIPKGYAYHDEEYKSPNPPESSKFTTLQRSTMTGEQAQQFRLAMYSLVDTLTTRAGMPPKTVYVMRPETMTPFYANLDNDLRESLRHTGYRLSDNPDDSYLFTYKAEILSKENRAADDMSPNVRLTIHVHDKMGEEGRILTQETGDFYIAGAETLNVPFNVNFPFMLLPSTPSPAPTFKPEQL